MTKLLLVRIVVTTCNAERFLCATLESVRAQSLTDWECVVVNDGCTDATARIAETFVACDTRIHTWSQANGGVASARNLGLSKIDPGSLYVAFLDADDVYIPGALDRLRRAVESEPGCVGAHGLPDTIDANGLPYEMGKLTARFRRRLGCCDGKLVELAASAPTDMATLYVMTFGLGPPGVFLLRRTVADRVGLFSPAAVPSEDSDYWIRAARHGSFKFVDEVVLYYRRHDANATNNGRRIDRQRLALTHSAYFSPENTRQQRRLLAACYRALQREALNNKAKRWHQAIQAGRPWEALRLAPHIAGRVLKFIRGFPTRMG